MRIRIKLAAVALLCGLSSFASAQAPSAGAAAPTGPGVRIGVIDIGYIFDNHPQMKPQMAAIDAQIKAAEDEINARREQMMKELEGLRTLQENSAQFKQKEEQLADAESKLKLDFVRREKQFQLDKAKVVYETYKQVETMTKAVAEANQFCMIMRYSRTEMDPSKPGTVQGGINKDIVYFHPQIDLTDYVLGQLKQSLPAPPAANVSGTPTQGQVPRTATGPVNGGVQRK